LDTLYPTTSLATRMPIYGIPPAFDKPLSCSPGPPRDQLGQFRMPLSYGEASPVKPLHSGPGLRCTSEGYPLQVSLANSQFTSASSSSNRLSRMFHGNGSRSDLRRREVNWTFPFCTSNLFLALPLRNHCRRARLPSQPTVRLLNHSGLPYCIKKPMVTWSRRWNSIKYRLRNEIK